MKQYLNIAKYNKFPISKIYNLNKKIKTKINHKNYTTLNNINNKRKSWASLQYYKGISEKFGKIFEKHNICLDYKTNNINRNKL